jgi:Filamin/ABP280 repeat
MDAHSTLPCVLQARDTANGKRHSGGDRFSVSVVMVDRPEVHGRAAVVDEGTGRYQCSYSVPMPGRYQVHVTHMDLGTDNPSHIRGSPFVIKCNDPWVRPRLLGLLPQKRKSATFRPLGGSLVLYGGDKSGPMVLDTSDNDWRWTPATMASNNIEPPSRTAHAAVPYGSDKMVLFAGVSLQDQSELADVWQLQIQDQVFSWAAAPSVKPFKRHIKRMLAEQRNILPEPQPVPTNGMHIQLTTEHGQAFWLSGHKWMAGPKHIVQLTNVDQDAFASVRWYINNNASEGVEPDCISTSAPFLMGTDDAGAPRQWTFEVGKLTITAIAVPRNIEAGEEPAVIVEEAAVVPAGGMEVRVPCEDLCKVTSACPDSGFVLCP